MQSTEKGRGQNNGRLIVIALVVIAALGAAATSLRYSSDNPSTTEARLETAQSALAIFPAHAAKNIQRGMLATVSLPVKNSPKTTGRVGTVKMENETTLVAVTLDAPVVGATPGSPCQVTVDTSIPPYVLKQP